MDVQIKNKVTLSKRFCGPPESANGGYTGGLLARQLIRGGMPENAEMTLRLKAAIPLDLELSIDGNLTDGLSLMSNDLSLATLAAGGDSLEGFIPQLPDYSHLISVAPELKACCSGFDSHPFQTCFVCGPKRQEGDGLCLYPGPLPGDENGLVLADWTPDQSLAEQGQVGIEFIWAALDCPGAFAILEKPENARLVPMVLAQISTKIQRRPKAGEQLALVAWPVSNEGRKAYAGTALIDADNQCIAISKQLWISLNK